MDKINPTSSYLVIVYQDSDNDLHKWALKNLNEMESYNEPRDNVTIVSISDQGKNGTQWKEAKVLLIQEDNDPVKVKSKVLEDLGQVNMADSSFMAKKISSIIKNFPAEHIFIIFSARGRGWTGAFQDQDRRMNLDQIKTALENITKETGRKIDILAWDSSYMAMAEVGYALRNYAKYMIASEKSIYASAWPYKNMLYYLSTGIDPEYVAKSIVKLAASEEKIKTLSAVDLSKAEELAKSIDDLAETILKYPQDWPSIKKVFRTILECNTCKIDEDYNQDYIDLRLLLNSLIYRKDININPEIKQKAKQTLEILREYVIASHSEVPFYHGVSIGTPINYDYSQTEFAQNTKWDEMYYKVMKSKT